MNSEVNAVLPRSKQGFTLIEMLVVVSVIGILVSIASYHNVQVLKRAKDAALMNELSLLRTAVHQFALQENGRFPDSLGLLSPAFLDKVPTTWKGSNGNGHYCYDPVEGTLTLYRADDQAASAIDTGGRKYADY